jgi:hypothetical protein
MGQIVSNYMKMTYPHIKVNTCRATKCDMCKTNSIFNNILKITSDEIDLYYELYKSKTLTQIFGKQLFKDNYNIIANDLFYFRYNNLPEVNYINYGIFANLDINKLKLSEFASNEVINDFNRIKNNKARFVIFMTDMYNTIIIPRFGSQLESNKDFKMDDIFTYEITITETSNIFKKYYIIWFSIIIIIIIIMIFFSV